MLNHINMLNILWFMSFIQIELFIFLKILFKVFNKHTLFESTVLKLKTINSQEKSKPREEL